MAAPVMRPQFFISRQDGSLTPLIALDELPHFVSVRGAPRLLNQNDTHGMTSLGSAYHRGRYYIVDYLAQGNAVVQLGDPNMVVVPKQTIMRNAAPKNTLNARPKGGLKKEYCSFWLRHGECDYQQQGCIYKHEMPIDPFILEKLGLRDIPRWYREKHNVRSLVPNIDGGHLCGNQPGLPPPIANGAATELSSGALVPVNNTSYPGGPMVPMSAHPNRVVHHGIANSYAANQAAGKTVVKEGPKVTNPTNMLTQQRVGALSQNHPVIGQSIVGAAHGKNGAGGIGYPYAQIPQHRQSYPNMPTTTAHRQTNNPSATNGYFAQHVGPNTHAIMPIARKTMAPPQMPKSPWGLHNDKADFSELPMTPFVMENANPDFLFEGELAKRKQHKSRCFYRLPGESKAVNKPSAAGSVNPNCDPKALYPFAAMPDTFAPKTGTNPVLYYSSSSSERNSPSQSTNSSVENGRRVSPDNFFVERTASMTSGVFEVGTGCESFGTTVKNTPQTSS